MLFTARTAEAVALVALHQQVVGGELDLHVGLEGDALQIEQALRCW
jgi:hypothetical protein